MGKAKKGIRSGIPPKLTPSHQHFRKPFFGLTDAETLFAEKARGLCIKKANEQVLENRELRQSTDLIHFARSIAVSFSDCIESATDEFGSLLADQELAKYGRINRSQRSKILEKCNWLASELADWNNSRWYLAESTGVFVWEKDAIDSSTRAAFVYQLNVFQENWSGAAEKSIDLRIATRSVFPTSHTRKKSKFKTLVARLKEDHSGISIHSILYKIDSMNERSPHSVCWPKEWKGTKHRLLVDLYSDPSHLGAVKTYISKIKPSKS